MMIQHVLARLHDQHPIGRSRNDCPTTQRFYPVMTTWVSRRADFPSTSKSNFLLIILHLAGQVASPDFTEGCTQPLTC